MHYQHRFHAGNFADVFKHVLLCALVQALNRKDKPWSYLETHAGAASYDLSDAAALKTGEWQDGIGRLWPPTESGALSDYLRIVRAHNPGPVLRHYPGSPEFVRALARPDDRLALCEKVPEIHAELRERMRGDARIAVHLRDGYEAHALLPPKEKRGLVLVDPPFERPDEFEALAAFLDKALARFAQGVFAVWYPLKKRYDAERWLRRLQRGLGRPSLNCRFDSGAPGEGQMRGCGLVVVNPPFQFEREAGAALRLLAGRLAQGRRAQAGCDWLIPES